MSKQKLEKAENWARQIGSTAVMIVHDGALIAAWGDTSAKSELASVRKSLLSALIGNAIERKGIDLQQTIGSLGIDDNEPSLSAEEKAANVRDLLQPGRAYIMPHCTGRAGWPPCAHRPI